MTKVTYTFDTEEDSSHLAAVQMALDMHSALCDMDQWLRDKIKYGTEPSFQFQEARDEFHGFLEGRHVDLDRVV